MKGKNCEVPKMDFELIKKDYGITENDDDFIYSIKSSIDRLTTPEQRIFLAYTELGTYAATARVFNVSPPTIKLYIGRIIEKIRLMIDD